MRWTGEAWGSALEGPSGRLYLWEPAWPRAGDAVAEFSQGRIVPLFPPVSAAQGCPHC
jgi:hypothetical protein